MCDLDVQKAFCALITGVCKRFPPGGVVTVLCYVDFPIPQSGMAPESFGGGYDAISSMEHSIDVCETTHVIQIYYAKNINFHGCEGDASRGDAFPHPPWSHP